MGISSIDDANSDFILDVLADENVPVIYGDTDTNGIPDACYLDKPSYETSTRTIYYTLNHEIVMILLPLNDSGESSVASKQNPETEWFADFDGDNYGPDDVTANVTYLDEDYDCFCQADCGQTEQCFGFDNNGNSTGVCLPTDTDSDGDLYTVCSGLSAM